MIAHLRRISNLTTRHVRLHSAQVLLAVVLVACQAESSDVEADDGRVVSDLVTVQSTMPEEPLALARLLTGLQRDLFARLGDLDQDPAPLLTREFRLIDRSDSLSWQQFSSSRPFARTDSYLTILAGRLPDEELRADRFELWRQQGGSVLVVSYLEDGGFNMTEWAPAETSWKARAMIINPPESTLEAIATHLKPILAR